MEANYIVHFRSLMKTHKEAEIHAWGGSRRRRFPAALGWSSAWREQLYSSVAQSLINKFRNKPGMVKVWAHFPLFCMEGSAWIPGLWRDFNGELLREDSLSFSLPIQQNCVWSSTSLCSSTLQFSLCSRSENLWSLLLSSAACQDGSLLGPVMSSLCFLLKLLQGPFSM